MVSSITSDVPSQSTLKTIFVVFLVHLIIFDYLMHRMYKAQIQQLLTLLFSGFMQVYAGVLLFKANTSGNIAHIPGLLALIPTLMDLKGNIEISMASRISTLANTTDQLKDTDSMMKILKQNIILVQCQVTIVATFAVLVTFGYGSLYKPEKLDLDKMVMLYAIALFTSSFTCTLLGLFLKNIPPSIISDCLIL